MTIPFALDDWAPIGDGNKVRNVRVAGMVIGRVVERQSGAFSAQRYGYNDFRQVGLFEDFDAAVLCLLEPK